MEEMFVVPSNVTCVGKSMSRWYGIGDDWIELGLPKHRDIDRKPENAKELE